MAHDVEPELVMGENRRDDERAPTLFVVIPCYNEVEALPRTARCLRDKLVKLERGGLVSAKSRVLFVDDGSTDGTWELIVKLNKEKDSSFTGISLSRNQGHQNALMAGLMCALDRGCDAAVSMDADLQDDPNAIDEMIKSFLEGAEVVFGVRNDRSSDTRFKRTTASVFYRIMSLMGAHTVPDSADFRLMSRRSLEALSLYGESSLFLRGIVADLGFNTAKVYYRRAERTAGESKYPLTKMIAFAADGITSFTVAPLRAVAFAGLFFVVVALVATAYALISLAMGSVVSGWTSLLVSIWFVGGSIMLSLGIVGEYVGKTYMESKRRPRYIIAKSLD